MQNYDHVLQIYDHIWSVVLSKIKFKHFWVSNVFIQFLYVNKYIFHNFIKYFEL